MTGAARATHRFECRLHWTGATTSYDAYDRTYRVEFEGKPTLTGSAAGAFRGDPRVHNPEDLLVAALSGCHFLSYAALCARRGVTLLAYDDEACGTMARVDGVMRFTDVVLRPVCTVDGDAAALGLASELHTQAHAECFIASSVRFPVRNEPTIRPRG